MNNFSSQPASAYGPQQNSLTLVSPSPRRPGIGVKGKPISLLANFFPVLSLPGQTITHYDVVFHPVASSRTSRRLFALWEDLNRNGILSCTAAVFDGRRNIFTAKPLPLPQENCTFSLELEDDIVTNGTATATSGYNMNDNMTGIVKGRRQKKEYKITIRKVSEINMSKLSNFLSGASQELPQDCIMALDVLMRHRPSMFYISIGRCFYSPGNAKPSVNGVEFWSGFHQSLRPASNRMLLNIDVSMTAFYEPGPVIDMVAKLLGKKSAQDVKTPLSAHDWNKLEQSLRNVKVITTHRHDKRKYKISSLTQTSAAETYFPVKDVVLDPMSPVNGSQPKQQQNGNRDDNTQTANGVRTESVANYFADRYDTPLQYSRFPCLIVGDPSRHVYLPMEVCEIVSGQRILKRLNEKQTADMIKFSCQPPQERMSKIMSGKSRLVSPEDEHLKGFNVSIDSKMATIDARIIPTPTISFHPSSRTPIISPSRGSWNMAGKRVAYGACLVSWSVLIFGHALDTPLHSVNYFIDELVANCLEIGINVMNRNPPVRHFHPDKSVETNLNDAFLDGFRAFQSRPQLLVCVLPASVTSNVYRDIKRVADTSLGVPTQCLHASKMMDALIKAKKQYYANVCLKINVKLGGMNAILGNQQLAFIEERPTMVLGADVTHPGPGDLNTPSIAALVGSLDPHCSRYCAAIRTQKARQEIIADLYGMSLELLTRFWNTNGVYPERILMYRDGVSEGQFREVVRGELEALRRAYTTLNPASSSQPPKITFIIVQKRHHARFFPVNRSDGDSLGNVLPGTVVESGVTHPSEFDFYLASHPGIQGTSKPTHYHVLHDDNSFTADGLTELTYRLCFLYCRATRAVSVCPPAYYAHLVAARARCHFRPSSSSLSSSSSSMDTPPVTYFSNQPARKGTVASSSSSNNGSVSGSTSSLDILPSEGNGNRLMTMTPTMLEEEGDIVNGNGMSFVEVSPALQNVMYYM